MQLTQRIFPTINILARVAAIFSLWILIPITVAWWGNDAGLQPFITSLASLLLFSGALSLLTHRYKREMKSRDGFILVVGLWTTLPAVAALPLMLFDTQLSFTHAYFETMSALTTTGATVLTGLDQLPASINLWRHLLNWLGGMGIIVLALSLIHI